MSYRISLASFQSKYWGLTNYLSKDAFKGERVPPQSSILRSQSLPHSPQSRPRLTKPLPTTSFRLLLFLSLVFSLPNTIDSPSTTFPASQNSKLFSQHSRDSKPVIQALLLRLPHHLGHGHPHLVVPHLQQAKQEGEQRSDRDSWFGDLFCSCYRS